MAIDIQILDQRGTNSRIAVLINNAPEEITKLNVKMFAQWIERNFANFIQVRPDRVELQRLKDALAQGLISEAAYSFLLGE